MAHLWDCAVVSAAAFSSLRLWLIEQFFNLQQLFVFRLEIFLHFTFWIFKHVFFFSLEPFFVFIFSFLIFNCLFSQFFAFCTLKALIFTPMVEYSLLLPKMFKTFLKEEFHFLSLMIHWNLLSFWCERWSFFPSSSLDSFILEFDWSPNHSLFCEDGFELNIWLSKTFKKWYLQNFVSISGNTFHYVLAGCNKTSRSEPVLKVECHLQTLTPSQGYLHPRPDKAWLFQLCQRYFRKRVPIALVTWVIHKGYSFLPILQHFSIVQKGGEGCQILVRNEKNSETWRE